MRQHLARYSWSVSFVSSRFILDAACGVGYGCAMMAEEGKAARVVGIDLSAEAIEEARRRYGHIQNIEFRIASVEDLPFEDGVFDVYTSFETIEHVPHPDQLLREAVRVLKPDGVLLISTPNRIVTNPGIPLEGKPFSRFTCENGRCPNSRTCSDSFSPVWSCSPKPHSLAGMFGPSRGSASYRTGWGSAPISCAKSSSS
ncbi:MAG: class I SAM-dependent methyltransferase [Armatimonadota bacterium]